MKLSTTTPMRTRKEMRIKLTIPMSSLIHSCGALGRGTGV